MEATTQPQSEPEDVVGHWQQRIQTQYAVVKGFWQKSVEATVTLGALLVEAKAAVRREAKAKKDVGRRRWSRFRLPFARWKAQRLMAIARHEDLSKASNWSFLPAEWTTLHHLSYLPPGVLAAKIASGEVHPGMLGPDAEKLRKLVTDPGYRAVAGEWNPADVRGRLRRAVDAEMRDCPPSELKVVVDAVRWLADDVRAWHEKRDQLPPEALDALEVAERQASVYPNLARRELRTVAHVLAGNVCGDDERALLDRVDRRARASAPSAATHPSLRVYLAGSLGRTREENAVRVGVRRRLHSYLDVKMPWPELLGMGGGEMDLFLDSGAFTAWSKGVSIDVEEYAKFALAHRDAFTVVANLDVIPGKPGEVPGAAEVERAAAQGWEHYEYLRKQFAGAPFTLVHTYHRGEDLRWLRRLMDESPYLAIGGLASKGLTTRDRITTLDAAWPLLRDDAGCPLRQVHGFGLTSIDLMQRYPWYSVDSSSWLQAGNVGGCYVRLGTRAYVVAFSSDSPKIEQAGKHFTTLTAREQADVRAYVEGKGYTVEQLAEDYTKRDELNALFFINLERGREYA